VAEKQFVRMEKVYGLKGRDLGVRISKVLEGIEMDGLSDDCRCAAYQLKLVWTLLGEKKARYDQWVGLYNDNPGPAWPTVDPRLSEDEIKDFLFDGYY